MQRFEDWPERLAAYLDACRTKEFEWGAHDCALFAASGVAAMTGEDFGAVFRGRYTTRRGASLALKRYGGGTLFDTVTKFLGPPRDNKALMSRGDVVGIVEDAGPAIGLCSGNTLAFAGKPAGLAFRPVSFAVLSWGF